MPTQGPFLGERIESMSNESSSGEQEAPRWSEITVPPGFVAVKRPEGATEEVLRNGYPAEARMFAPSKNCTVCYGGGYTHGTDGKVIYCPCQFDQVAYHKLLQAAT